MPKHLIDVQYFIPARGQVEVEADTYDEAMAIVRDSIGNDGFKSVLLDGVEFTADWQLARRLSVIEPRNSRP